MQKKLLMPSLFDKSDEDLMKLYQSGDDKAFEALYLRHSGRVLAFLQSKSDPQNARELLQETFLKLHRARQKYSPQYPFLPWLFTIARNVFFDFSRLSETKVYKKSEAQDVEVLDGDITPEFSVALKGLSGPQKKAIELRYLSDWSFEKIAADMNTSPLNVRQIISRGIKKLRLKSGGK